MTPPDRREDVTAPDSQEPPRDGRFGRRVLRAMRLEAELYEEVEADPDAIGQATAVVALTSLAIGIGSFSNGGWSGIFWTAIVMFASWLVWAGVSCVIGVNWLAGPETESDVGELLRTIGFAAAPGLVAVLGVVPGLNPWLLIGSLAWMGAALVVAIRQALDYRSTWRAIAVCVLTSPLAVVPLILVLLFTGPWPI